MGPMGVPGAVMVLRDNGLKTELSDELGSGPLGVTELDDRDAVWSASKEASAGLVGAI